MMISNKTYDILKWVAIVAIPALEALWLTIGKVWNFPYLTEIGATIAAVGVFLGALLGVSSYNYKKMQGEPMDFIEDIEEVGEDE